MASSDGESRRRLRAGRFLVVLILALTVAAPTAFSQVEARASATIHSQYIVHGRDYTLAGAPVGILGLHAGGSVGIAVRGGWSAGLESIAPLWRRGAPYQTAQTDAIRATLGAAGTFFAEGALDLGVGVTANLYYRALRNDPPRYGAAVVHPYAHIGAAFLYGAPRWSVVADLTPDQVGWRDGLEWRPSFSVPWGTLSGFIGAYRPHGFLKQSSDSTLNRLVRGEIDLALISLIPSDLRVGVRSRIPLGRAVFLEPAVHLLIAPSRWQTPQQIVPTASLTAAVTN
jgi:hypothetical protein